jgi:hypothetical protein
MSSKNTDDVLSKQGEPIQEGDHVYTKIRGGRHEGDVEKVVTTKEEAEEENVKNPPKVVFHENICRRPISNVNAV